jgi:hypothetical protein
MPPKSRIAAGFAGSCRCGDPAALTCTDYLPASDRLLLRSGGYRIRRFAAFFLRIGYALKGTPSRPATIGHRDFFHDTAIGRDKKHLILTVIHPNLRTRKHNHTGHLGKGLHVSIFYI